MPSTSLSNVEVALVEFFMVVGLLIVGGVFVTLLFGLSKSAFDRCIGQDRRTVEIGLRRSLLIGTLYAGAVVATDMAVSPLLHWLHMRRISSPYYVPMHDASILFAIDWALHLLPLLVIKWLLTISFIPCRAGQGAAISAIWTTFEIALLLFLQAILGRGL
jgi:hypothetical protein